MKQLFFTIIILVCVILACNKVSNTNTSDSSKVYVFELYESPINSITRVDLPMHKAVDKNGKAVYYYIDLGFWKNYNGFTVHVFSDSLQQKKLDRFEIDASDINQTNKTTRYASGNIIAKTTILQKIY